MQTTVLVAERVVLGVIWLLTAFTWCLFGIHLSAVFGNGATCTWQVDVRDLGAGTAVLLLIVSYVVGIAATDVQDTLARILRGKGDLELIESMRVAMGKGLLGPIVTWFFQHQQWFGKDEERPTHFGCVVPHFVVPDTNLPSLFYRMVDHVRVCGAATGARAIDAGSSGVWLAEYCWAPLVVMAVAATGQVVVMVRYAPPPLDWIALMGWCGLLAVLVLAVVSLLRERKIRKQELVDDTVSAFLACIHSDLAC